MYAPFAWVGHRIDELERTTGTRVAFLRRLGVGVIAADDTVIQEGDYLSIFMRESDAVEIHRAIEDGPTDGGAH